MLVWLTSPFYDFCGFRSVAVNSVYKLQFFYIHDVIVSDHKPVTFCMKCDVSSSTLADTISDKNTATWIPNWQHSFIH